MKFSTFHAFMLGDAKEVAQDHLLEGQGIGKTHHGAMRDELALIRRADELGFDTCWMREHHFTDYGFLPNTMVMAAHAAAVTERIRLGTAVVTLPLHHPVRAAEDIALVDVLSGGRVDVGIGRGYQQRQHCPLCRAGHPLHRRLHPAHLAGGGAGRHLAGRGPGPWS